METQSTTPPPVPGGQPPPPAPGPAPVGTGSSGSTPEQREKWRRKARLAYLRKQVRLGKADPSVLDGETGGTAGADPGPVGAPPPPAPGVASVPWSPDILRPLFEATVPEVEKLDVASLKAKAAEIDPRLAPVVEKDAAWNPVAKATICTTGPVVVANTMNSMGISAEHAPAVALVAAVGAIFTGRMILARKLEEMKAAKEVPAPAPPPAPAAP